MADRSKLIRKAVVMQLKEGKEEEYRASHNEVRVRGEIIGGELAAESTRGAVRLPTRGGALQPGGDGLAQWWTLSAALAARRGRSIRLC